MIVSVDSLSFSRFFSGAIFTVNSIRREFGANDTK